MACLEGEAGEFA
ncbi:hypothetical protein JL09_g6981, partial [Pichia kudriavzevii]